MLTLARASGSRVAVAVAVQARSCPTLRPHGLQPTRLLRPRDFPGKSTGVGCCFLLQGIFLTQGSNPGLLRCRQTFYPLSHQGKASQNMSYRRDGRKRILRKRIKECSGQREEQCKDSWTLKKWNSTVQLMFPPNMPRCSGRIWELVRKENSRGPFQIWIRSSEDEDQQPVLWQAFQRILKV